MPITIDNRRTQYILGALNWAPKMKDSLGGLSHLKQWSPTPETCINRHAANQRQSFETPLPLPDQTLQGSRGSFPTSEHQSPNRPTGWVQAMQAMQTPSHEGLQ